MMHTARSIAKDSLFSFLNTLVVGGFGILITVIVARRLNPSAMGNYSFTIWLFTALVPVLSLGLPNALIRYGAEAKERPDKGIAGQLLSRAIVSSVILALGWCLIMLLLTRAPWISARLPSLFRYRSDFILIGFALMFLNNVLASYVKSQRRFDWLVIVNTLTYVLISVLSLWLGRSASDEVPFIIVYTLGIGGSVILLIVLLRSAISLHFGQDPEVVSVWKRLIRYSLSVTLIVLFDTIVWQRSESFFLLWFGQSDQVAFYNIAYDLSSRVMQLIPGSLVIVLLPFFSALYGKSDLGNIHKWYTEATRYLALLSLPLATILFVFAGPAVEHIYGTEYLPVIPVLRILVLASALGAIAGAGSAVVYTLEKQNIILLMAAFLAPLNIGMDLLLIPRYGAMGASIANSTSQILGVTAGSLYLIKIVKVSYPLGSIIRVAVSSGLMGLTMWMVLSGQSSLLRILLSGLAGIFLFIIATWILDIRHHDFIDIKQFVRFFSIIDRSN